MRLRRLCLEIFALRRFFSEPIEVCSACQFAGAQRNHQLPGTATEFFAYSEASARARFKRATCSPGFTLRKTAEIRPLRSMTNVVLSTPMYFLPYMFFSTQTP